MSDTPRTDQVVWCDSEAECDVVSADFARKLERELNALQEECDRLATIVDSYTRMRANIHRIAHVECK